MLRGKSLRPGGPTRAAIGDVNITVGGDVDITKEPDGPIILLGAVDAVRGTYQFQGRRFDLVRGGTVKFTGEPQINPLLDVTATREIPNTGVEARVHIKGSVNSPELELTSTPPLDESDILSLIVFNRPVNELGSGERASLAATAGGIATGFLAAPLGRVNRAGARPRSVRDQHDHGIRGARCWLHRRSADRRAHVLPAAPAVRRADDERVHARIPARATSSACRGTPHLKRAVMPTGLASVESSAPGSI